MPYTVDLVAFCFNSLDSAHLAHSRKRPWLKIAQPFLLVRQHALDFHKSRGSNMKTRTHIESDSLTCLVKRLPNPTEATTLNGRVASKFLICSFCSWEFCYYFSVLTTELISNYWVDARDLIRDFEGSWYLVPVMATAWHIANPMFFLALYN